MEGEGITNYDASKPSYGFTTATTEFDDALLRRGIVNEHQVMLAKGMSERQAAALAAVIMKGGGEEVAAAAREEADDKTRKRENHRGVEYDDDAEESDSDDEFLDDDFVDRYRQKRLEELKLARERKKAPTLGEAVLIDRAQWMREVNEASETTWVVVCLTSSDDERTGRAEAAVRELAAEHAATKFVLIPSASAIPNWPHENLPSMFLYRHGQMRHELVRMPVDIDAERLGELFDRLEVFET